MTLTTTPSLTDSVMETAQILPDAACGSRPCEQCVVRDRALCASLSTSDREDFIRLGRIVTLEAGTPLLWEADDSSVVATVIDGAMKIALTTADGREQIVGVAYPSDFIGRPYARRVAQDATALGPTTLCLFPRAAFDRFAADHPEMEHSLLHRTLDELDRARAWMLLLGRKTAQAKIATFLLDLSTRLGHAHGGPDAGPLDRVALPFGRQQLADILGLTIETVSRQLSQLKRGGVIALPDRRHVEIRDRAQLEAMADPM